MGILKKLKKKPVGVKIGSAANLFLLIDKMKNNRILKTTDTGVFYTFPEVLQMGHNPEALLRNFYIYGRSTDLLKEGDILTIRDIDDPHAALATVLADHVKILDLPKTDEQHAKP
ncbi:hypothetical protein QE382_002139 [Sphingobacterium zeae]|uniref:Uncharacterized protein n=1 Tax=Sphingobacterium zeae TaxID=1776859 RepID=A0ABU0U5B9_9SPHI|nr:hypothetical protein [Sphingobacterium zeae]MDQ1150155.1 hypothetical protein [Sphingobacterium zeae]